MPTPKKTFDEDLTAQVDGVTDTFATARVFDAGTLRVYLNGQRLRKGATEDFVELSTSSFQMLRVPRATDVLLVQYEADDTGTGFPFVTVTGIPPGQR